MNQPFAPGSVSLRLYPHADLPATAIVDELREQAALAARHGLQKGSVEKHARKEEWTRLRRQYEAAQLAKLIPPPAPATTTVRSSSESPKPPTTHGLPRR